MGVPRLHDAQLLLLAVLLATDARLVRAHGPLLGLQLRDGHRGGHRRQGQGQGTPQHADPGGRVPGHGQRHHERAAQVEGRGEDAAVQPGVMPGNHTHFRTLEAGLKRSLALGVFSARSCVGLLTAQSSVPTITMKPLHALLTEAQSEF